MNAMKQSPATTHAHLEVERLRLDCPPPFNWPAMLAFFRLRAIPGVEVVDGWTYRRTIVVAGAAGWLSVSPEPGGEALGLTLAVPPGAAGDVAARVRRLFDLDADYPAMRRRLAADPLLGGLLSATPGLRLPGAWDPFEFAVRAVLGQQISVKAATTIAGRVAQTFGAPLETGWGGLDRVFPSAAALASADLSGLGLTQRRSQTLANLASDAAADPSLLVPAGGVDAFIERFCRLPGIGPWTAQYVALRALGEPDAFPASDLGIMKALGLSRARDVLARAEPWRPWRGYAAVHLWHSMSAGG